MRIRKKMEIKSVRVFMAKSLSLDKNDRCCSRQHSFRLQSDIESDSIRVWSSVAVVQEILLEVIKILLLKNNKSAKKINRICIICNITCYFFSNLSSYKDIVKFQKTCFKICINQIWQFQLNIKMIRLPVLKILN